LVKTEFWAKKKGPNLGFGEIGVFNQKFNRVKGAKNFHIGGPKLVGPTKVTTQIYTNVNAQTFLPFEQPLPGNFYTGNLFNGGTF